jgi:DNA-directed RNA polymerase specialized sigma24 family protein
MKVYRVERTEHDGYVLFRRAIVESDADAWAKISACYRPLLIAWAAQCGARMQLMESSADIADQALARAWVAISPAQFSRFPNLAALLAYLRTCVTATAIDSARTQALHERRLPQLEGTSIATSEQIVLAKIRRADLWRLVSRLVATTQERTILYESFVLDLPPRTILAHHPDLFADIAAVYFAKRNLLDRLRRNRELWDLCQELLAEAKPRDG